MNTEWEIPKRSVACTKSGHAFQNAEWFYTLLYREKHGFRREDLCESAFREWENSTDSAGGEGTAFSPVPFSFWRSRFEVIEPTAPAPNTLQPSSAIDLLRRLVHEGAESSLNTIYILALMLERKRVLKQVDRKNSEDQVLLVYEAPKLGEVFVIRDPELKLEQLAEIQQEVATELALLEAESALKSTLHAADGAQAEPVLHQTESAVSILNSPQESQP